MPRQRQEFQIFLASPGDVPDERRTVRTIVDELNRTLGRNHGFLLTVVGWDTDARPGFGTDAQELINLSIGQMAEYDLFVGILWNRFGTETPRAGSGTEEEFNRAAEAYKTHGRPEIMLYAGQIPVNLTSPAELEQKGKVLAFLSRVSPTGLYWKYANLTEFGSEFRRHLEGWVLGRLNEQSPEPPRTLSTPIHQAAVPTAMPPVSTPSNIVTHQSPASPVKDWVLLAGSFFPSDSVASKSEDLLVLELVPQDSEEDAVLRELQRTNVRGHYQEPVSYAHGNDGGIARVQSAESKTADGRTVWTIILKAQQQNNGPIAEATINGITPDKAAELRARLLLLNEPIRVESTRGSMPEMGAKMIVSSMKEKQGIFPDLWTKFGKDPNLFLPLARLWTIYILRTSNICDHVLELRLAFADDKRALDVVFRGSRSRQGFNQRPGTVSVTGQCLLLSK